MKQKDIVFTNVSGTSDIPKEYYPKLAKLEIPNWYKELNSYINNEKVYSVNDSNTGVDVRTTGTIKKCMPVFDAITSGYIIYSVTDLYIQNEDFKGKPLYIWPSVEILQFHSITQAPNYPLNTGHTLLYPKWINPWSIQTPKGYSTLFVQPFHRESVFTILPGIVDTDKYSPPINFPFVLNDINFTGLIPAGTPIAQVIPFKRDSWNLQFGKEKDILKIQSDHTLIRSKFFDGYKTLFRQTKEYK